MILKLSLNTQIICIIYVKILKNIIQIRNAKYWSFLMIWSLICLVIKNPIVTELFIRGRKLNISLVFFTQSYFAVLKGIRLNSTHYFIIIISNKRELQKITFTHSSHIDFKDFLNLYKICAAKPYSFLVINATLASDNHLCFRKNLLERI